MRICSIFEDSPGHEEVSYGLPEKLRNFWGPPRPGARRGRGRPRCRPAGYQVMPMSATGPSGVRPAMYGQGKMRWGV